MPLKKIKTEHASADPLYPYAEYVEIFDRPFCQTTLDELRRYFYEHRSSTTERESLSRSGKLRTTSIPLEIGPVIERPEHAGVKQLLDSHRASSQDEDEFRVLGMLKYFEKYPPSLGGPVAPWVRCVGDAAVEPWAIDVSEEAEVIDVEKFIFAVLAQGSAMKAEPSPPPGEDSLCPICGKKVPDVPTERASPSCCGAYICKACFLDYQEQGATKCPTCDCNLPNTPEDNADQLHKNAVQGHSWAQFSLGQSFSQGHGVPVGLSEAFCWFMKAAVAGHPLAEYNVASSYKAGGGVDASNEKAAEWYEKAAGHGLASAQHQLWDCYLTGTGVARSLSKATHWCSRAAAQGYAPAIDILPKLLELRAESDGSPCLAVGQTVMINGLASTSAKKFNACIGKVHAAKNEAGRYGIRIMGSEAKGLVGKTLAIKRDNLICSQVKRLCETIMIVAGLAPETQLPQILFCPWPWTPDNSDELTIGELESVSPCPSTDEESGHLFNSTFSNFNLDWRTSDVMRALGGNFPVHLLADYFNSGIPGNHFSAIAEREYSGDTEILVRLRAFAGAVRSFAAVRHVTPTAFSTVFGAQAGFRPQPNNGIPLLPIRLEYGSLGAALSALEGSQSMDVHMEGA